MSAGLVLRWTLGTALAGAAVGAIDAFGVGSTATLLLPGLAMGLAQRLAAPRRVPPVWTLFSGLAWVAGALLDATIEARPVGVGTWAVPAATMALWQTFLLNDPRRSWPWIPASLLGAVALQGAALATFPIVAEPLVRAFGPGFDAIVISTAGFAAYGLVTGLALPLLARRPSEAAADGT